jgi:hypothetical protein
LFSYPDANFGETTADIRSRTRVAFSLLRPVFQGLQENRKNLLNIWFCFEQEGAPSACAFGFYCMVMSFMGNHVSREKLINSCQIMFNTCHN